MLFWYDLGYNVIELNVSFVWKELSQHFFAECLMSNWWNVDIATNVISRTNFFKSIFSWSLLMALYIRNKLISYNDLFVLLYPPNNEVVGGYIGFTPSVCPSVCPSVRPSVPAAVSAL